MLSAPIKHFPFNTSDAFYFILYLLYAIVMTTMWFSTATEEISPVSFMPKYYVWVKTCETGMFLFLIYLMHLSRKFLTDNVGLPNYNHYSVFT